MAHSRPVFVHNVDRRWAAAERHGGVRLLALQRLLAVPAFLLVGLMQDEVHRAAFVVVLAVIFVVDLAQLPRILSPRWHTLPLPQLLVLDIAAMLAAVALTGGDDSDLRFLTALMLPIPALVLPLRTLAPLLAGLLVALTVTLLAGTSDDDVGITAITYALIGVLVLAVGAVNDRVLGELEHRAEDRRRLLARVLDTETQRRRLLAQDLHDRSLQTLLAARQDLQEAEGGDLAVLEGVQRELRQVTETLREAIYALHHGALVGTDLATALGALATRTRENALLEVELSFDGTPTAPHDELLYAIAREAVVNALGHAGVRRLHVAVRRSTGGDQVRMTVHDDGRPRHADDLAGDVTTGRTGMAAFRERAAEAGGLLALEPVEGTCVCVVLPLGRVETAELPSAALA